MFLLGSDVMHVPFAASKIGLMLLGLFFFPFSELEATFSFEVVFYFGFKKNKK